MSAQTETDAGRNRTPELAPQRADERAAQSPRQPGAFDPSELNPPTPPQPRPAKVSDAGFGSFG